MNRRFALYGLIGMILLVAPSLFGQTPILGICPGHESKDGFGCVDESAGNPVEPTSVAAYTPDNPNYVQSGTNFNWNTIKMLPPEYVTPNWTLILPDDDPKSGQVLLCGDSDEHGFYKCHWTNMRKRRRPR